VNDYECEQARRLDQEAVSLVKQGKLDEAIEHLRRALSLSPACAVLHQNLGATLGKQGKLDDAIACLCEAVRLQPDHVESHGNLALAYTEKGQVENAVRTYQQLLQLCPDNAHAHCKLADLYRRMGKLDEAVGSYSEAIRLEPTVALAHHNLGLTFAQQHKFDRAISCYREALRLQPDYADAHNNLGVVFQDQDKLDEAIACFRESLRMRPDCSDTYNNLGIALSNRELLDEALAAYQEALRLRPRSPAVLNNVGNALRKQGKLSEAEAALREALKISADYAEAHNNLGIALVQQGRVDEGMACYQEALRLRPEYPEAHLNLSLNYLLKGRFDEGWSEYEWRWRMKGRALPSANKPLWDGTVPWQPFTVLLMPEQGLGDTIQFVRYAALAQQRGATVVLQSSRPLTRLMTTCVGVDRVVEQDAPLPHFDVIAPLLRLPWLFGTSLATIPAPVPYLFADPARREYWREKLADRPGLKVGLVWQGNPQYPGDRIRSARLQQMSVLARAEGVHFVSLQKGAVAQQQAELHGRFVLSNVGADEWPDFAETAAVVANLDLVISVDTAVAHLAGALGVPVWLALPFAPDWRWLQDRDDTPWYPTMRLFRQTQPGDWDAVFERMAEELLRWNGGSQQRRLQSTDPVTGSDPYRTGMDLLRQGHPAEAVDHLRRSLEMGPEPDGAHNNLGVALAGLRRYAEAAASFRNVVRLRPVSPEGHGNLGLAYLNQGSPAEALVFLQRAIHLNGNSAETHNNVGVAWTELGRPDRALVSYDEAMRLDPAYAAARTNRARALLKLGDFRRGWEEYEWRWRLPGNMPPPLPAWDRAPLTGRTILLHAEQGLGDTLQFIRYAAQVKDRGGKVLVECPAPLRQLISTCPGVDGVLAPDAGPPPIDFHAPLLSLPRLFGTDFATIPASVPYLSAPPQRREYWRQQLSNTAGFKLGLTWQGNPNFGGDRHRSARLVQMAPLARVLGVRLYSLQKGPGVEQLREETGLAVSEFGPDGCPDLTETAAIMASLDLVIAVDTAIAHLAGALGVPVWLALSEASDWRWLSGREDTPWYPSMRLFRQRRRGDWDGVFQRMATALEKRCREQQQALPTPAGSSRAQDVIDNVVAEYQHGLALVRKGQLSAGVNSLRKAVQLRPGNAEWQHNLGVVLAQQGDLDDAITCFREALRLSPEGVDGFGNLGLALLQRGQAREAAECFQEAIRRRPHSHEAHNNLGVAFVRLGRHAQAVDCYRKALEFKPDYAEALNNLGNALRLQGKPQEALAPLEEALRLRPKFAEVLNNLGIALSDLDRLEEAIDCYARTLELDPAHLDARNNLGVLLVNLGRIDEAIPCFDELIRRNPEAVLAHNNRAFAWLRKGDFAHGWAEYEWRWRAPGAVPPPGPTWDGSSLGGRTILLHAEQGLGDTLQFIRHAAMVKALGGKVLLECPTPLVRLLAACPSLDGVLSPGAPRPPIDCHVPLLSLPRVFQTDQGSIPASIPYLCVDPERRLHWQQQLATAAGLKIGMAWQGNAAYAGDRHRSARLAEMAPLRSVPGVQLYSLQKGHGADQLRRVEFAVTDLGAEEWPDFMETACVVANLDLVIAVDTAVAHLAGALGIPVWVALPAAADWRWLLDRDDTPWYPTMRLFRQRRRGDWDEVFRRMADALRCSVARPTRVS
jgi:tetratricopeptide (TPR) repeat protein